MDHTQATRARRYPIWRLLRANIYDFVLLLRESWVVLSGFTVVTLVGTLYLSLISPLRLGLAAALYETLKLLTLQSGLDLPADPLGTLLFFLIPLLGLALIFQGVLNFGRLLLDKGGRREAWQIALASTYQDHVILCGLNRVNLRVLLQLIEAGYPAIVIERNWSGEFVERALALKVPVVLGDAREPEILRQAGIGRARAIVASINNDLMNIEIALAARALRPAIRVILRVFNEDLDRNLERSFGTNSVFSASALAAPTFAAAAVSHAIDYVLPLGDTLLGVAQVSIANDSRLAGFVRAIEEQNGIRILYHQGAARPQGQQRLPHRLERGDTITAIGPIAQLDTLRAQNMPGSRFSFLQARRDPPPPAGCCDRVIVCGLGKIGYRVVLRLYQMEPRPHIVVVRHDDVRQEFQRHIARLNGVETVIGDARSADVLRQAGLDNAYAVAALTSDDDQNLQIGLAARRLRPDVHLVLRVFSDSLAEQLVNLFGIHTAYSTSGLAGPTLAAAAVLGDVGQGLTVGPYLFATDRMVVRAGGPLAGKTIEEVRAQFYALVVGMWRDVPPAPLRVLPALDTQLQPGDSVMLLASLESLARIRAATPPGDEPPAPAALSPRSTRRLSLSDLPEAPQRKTTPRG